MLPLLPLFAAAALVSPAHGQLHQWGPCPTPTLPATLTETDLTGTAAAPKTWYEQRRYPSWLEGGNRCVSWKYTKNGAKIDIVVDMIKHHSTPIKMEAQIVYTGAPTYPKFYYTQTKLPGTNTPLWGVYDYRIIAIDANHVVAWSCKQHWFSNEQLLWILTADKNPTQAKIDAALQAASTAGLVVNNNNLQQVLQTC